MPASVSGRILTPKTNLLCSSASFLCGRCRMSQELGTEFR